MVRLPGDRQKRDRQKRERDVLVLSFLPLLHTCNVLTGRSCRATASGSVTEARRLELNSYVMKQKNWQTKKGCLWVREIEEERVY